MILTVILTKIAQSWLKDSIFIAAPSDVFILPESVIVSPHLSLILLVINS